MLKVQIENIYLLHERLPARNINHRAGSSTRFENIPKMKSLKPTPNTNRTNNKNGTKD